MQCRNCGTDIADKALICFRCGVATAEPQLQAAASARKSSSRVNLLAAVVVLVLLAVYVGRC